MEHIRDYVESLKREPEHVRRRIALGASLGLTALVAVGWLTTLVSSGALALAPSAPPGPAAPDVGAAAKETAVGVSSLLGAVSAYQSGGTDGGAGVVIVNDRASSTLDAPREGDTRTVIPF